VFHATQPHYFIQGGDITKGDGTGGESIYGKFFDDENHNHKHDRPFKVAMANLGEKNTNSSQFLITVLPTPWLSEENVVFGEVIKGLNVVRGITQFGSRLNGF
jgi:peptidylprolyl isomerase